MNYVPLNTWSYATRFVCARAYSKVAGLAFAMTNGSIPPDKAFLYRRLEWDLEWFRMMPEEIYRHHMDAMAPASRALIKAIESRMKAQENE